MPATLHSVARSDNRPHPGTGSPVPALPTPRFPATAAPDALGPSPHRALLKYRFPTTTSPAPPPFSGYQAARSFAWVAIATYLPAPATASCAARHRSAARPCEPTGAYWLPRSASWASPCHERQSAPLPVLPASRQSPAPRDHPPARPRRRWRLPGRQSVRRRWSGDKNRQSAGGYAVAWQYYQQQSPAGRASR